MEERQHYKSMANPHFEFYMKFWSSQLREDKLELEYAHGETPRMIQGIALH